MAGTGGRTAERKRETSETSITVRVDIDGSGHSSVRTPNAFLNHIIELLAKHSMMDITIKSDSHDAILHHLVEDVAITLGEAIHGALGGRDSIIRFGDASAPMDEALAGASVDLIKRQFCAVSLGIRGEEIEGMKREDLEHFFDSLLKAVSCSAHLTVTRGSNDHHRAEAAIKALALALRRAAEPDPRRDGSPSSKGTM